MPDAYASRHITPISEFYSMARGEVCSCEVDRSAWKSLWEMYSQNGHTGSLDAPGKLIAERCFDFNFGLSSQGKGAFLQKMPCSTIAAQKNFMVIVHDTNRLSNIYFSIPSPKCIGTPKGDIHAPKSRIGSL
jgi:hypothetical protein